MSIVAFSASANARNTRSTKIRNKRSGFTTAVSAVILIAAVSILGSVMVIWANSTFNAERQRIGDYYETNSNLLKETLMIEDVWLSKVPQNYVNLTLRNIGDITVDIKEVKIIALDSAGAALNCSPPPDPPAQCTRTVTAPFFPNNSDGVISSKQSLRIDVDKNDWDHADSRSLDISITTERGSMERIIWKVK